jgi:hypothetical protein
VDPVVGRAADLLLLLTAKPNNRSLQERRPSVVITQAIGNAWRFFAKRDAAALSLLLMT